MSQQLLRRAWDALDTFKQAYLENWHEDDQQVLDDLMKADLDLPEVKREFVGLTEDDRVLIKHDANFNQFMTAGEYADRVQQLTEARLKDKNT